MRKTSDTRRKFDSAVGWVAALAALAAAAAIVRGFLPDAGAATVSSPPAPPAYVVCNATCSAAGIRIGQTYVIVKPSSTLRNTTITATSDPALSFTSVPAGTYIVSAALASEIDTSGVAGFRANLSPTAPMYTAGCVAGHMSGSGNATGGTGSGGVVVSAASYTAIATTLMVYCRGTYINASSATVAVQWAQATSNAANTILNAGSTLALTRLL